MRRSVRPVRPVHCDVWFLDGNTVEDLADADQLLDGEERLAASRYRDETAYRAFVLRRGLTKWLIGTSLGTPARSVTFSRRCAFCGNPRHGKPRLDDHDLAFSVSWSGPYVVIAIAREGEIGVDVEMLRGEPPSADHMSAVFGPSGAGTTEPVLEEHSVLQVWTRKESVLKCAGIGMAVAPGDLEVTSPHEPPALVRLPAALGRPEDFFLYELDIDGRVVSNLAANRAMEMAVHVAPLPGSRRWRTRSNVP